MLLFWIITIAVEALLLGWLYHSSSNDGGSPDSQMGVAMAAVFMTVACAAFDLVALVVCLGIKFWPR